MANSTTAATTKSVFQFKNTVSTKIMKTIYLNENFADFQFFINEGGVRKSIPAHKAILAAASDVFAAMLNGKWQEENEAEIEDASFDVFKEFLQFLYLPQVKVSAENICEVINVANKYNVRQCVELCAQQIKEQIILDDVCTGLDLALQFDLSELKDHCLAEIRVKTTEVLASDGFLRCSKYSLKSILEMENVDCEEIDMFNASLNWAKHACEVKKTDPSVAANVREELGDCLHLIRFGAMKSEEVLKCVSTNDGFFKRCELQDLFLTNGSNRSAMKVFKNIVARETLWRDGKLLQCDLQHSHNTFYLSKRTESTTFQINKRLLFGGVALGSTFTKNKAKQSIKVDLFVFETLQGDQKESLRQTFQTNTTEAFLKFEKVIKVQANTEYEVCIETQNREWIFFGYTIGPNQQKTFGDGIVIQTKDKCSGFIKSLYFN